MSTPTTDPHISKTDGEPAHLERLPRIRIAQIVMDQLAHGWAVDEMCRHHPELTPAEIHAAMLYYWDHRHEIDSEIQAEWRQVDQDAAGPLPRTIALRLRQSA